MGIIKVVYLRSRAFVTWGSLLRHAGRQELVSHDRVVRTSDLGGNRQRLSTSRINPRTGTTTLMRLEVADAHGVEPRKELLKPAGEVLAVPFFLGCPADFGQSQDAGESLHEHAIVCDQFRP